MIRKIPLRPAASATGRLLSTPISRSLLPLASARCHSTELAAVSAHRPTTPLFDIHPSRKNSSRRYPTPTPTPTPFEAPTSASPPAAAPKIRKLTYRVGRTASNNLAVYDSAKSGGTNKFTQVKKISGNAQDLKKDVIAELGFKKDEVAVNPVTGHLIIKVKKKF